MEGPAPNDRQHQKGIALKVATAKIDSKSRNVRAYVKQSLKVRKLSGRIAAHMARVAPLQAACNKAKAEALVRKAKLTGSQIAEAERLLRALDAVNAEVADMLATPCKPELASA